MCHCWAQHWPETRHAFVGATWLSSIRKKLSNSQISSTNTRWPTRASVLTLSRYQHIWLIFSSYYQRQNISIGDASVYVLHSQCHALDTSYQEV